MLKTKTKLRSQYQNIDEANSNIFGRKRALINVYNKHHFIGMGQYQMLYAINFTTFLLNRIFKFTTALLIANANRGRTRCTY